VQKVSCVEAKATLKLRIEGVRILISVVIYGQRPESIARLTAETICRFGAVQLHLPGEAFSVGDGATRYLIEAVRRIEHMELSRSVLLLADQSAPRCIRMREDTVVVAAADNRRMSRALKGCANPVVTCGTGVRDTVTLSSSAGERTILCVQRRLPTVGGEWLEPFEFAVTTNGCGIRGALLAAATAAVCGCDLTAGDIEIGNGLRV